MKYPLSPYSMNTYYKREAKLGTVFVAENDIQEVDSESMRELLDIINGLSEVKSVFEVGFGFGEALVNIQNLFDLEVGGVEFDPLFVSYGNNFFKINSNPKIKIEIGVDPGQWTPFANEYDVVIVGSWVNLLNNRDREAIIHKAKNMAKNFVVMSSNSERGQYWDLIDVLEFENTLPTKPTPEEVILEGKSLLNTPNLYEENNDRVEQQEGDGDGRNFDDRSGDLREPDQEEGNSRPSSS